MHATDTKHPKETANKIGFLAKHLTRYMEKKVSLRLLFGAQHSLIMADFLMSETQHPIIVILFLLSTLLTL